MKCNTCECNFALLHDNYDGVKVDCKYEKYNKCIYKIKEEQRKSHKCEGCKWSTFTGIKYFCMLPRCIPNLGNFNGVDRSGK
ncbi:hypothetical protein [Tissierella sp.]|uniref:hypothetical protein n=1 Tax=Tissierella sp. TaxID=41274 RepID=UPI002855183B|nr:hypothetical protein [Tissierella sp.]MDR7856105.1 hypothetical protein [Tissierella sp.]